MNLLARWWLAALILGSVSGGFAARFIVNSRSPRLGLALALASALLFVVASWRATYAITGQPTLWRRINAVLLWALATILMLAYGFLFFSSWQTDRPWERIAEAVAAAAAAGLTAGALPWLSVAVPAAAVRIGAWALRKLIALEAVIEQIRSWIKGGGVLTAEPRGAETLGPPGRRERWSATLTELAQGWWFPPSLTRVLRCVLMSVLAMALSLAVQAIAYHLRDSETAHTTARLNDVTLPTLSWIGGSLIGWLLACQLFHPTETPPRARHLAHGLGLASVFIAAMLIFFGWTAGHSAVAKLVDRDSSLNYQSNIPAQVNGTPVANLDDQTLANLFVPHFRFAAGEKWFPTTVTWYLANKTDQAAQDKKPYCKNTCYALKDCDGRDSDCASNGKDALQVYALRQKRQELGSLPPPYQSVTQVIQYWIFYNYDSFARSFVSQWHQADWEQITVGLAGSQPSFVAYSAHCFGTLLPWHNVPKEDNTHPVAFVAEGTHANYPRQTAAPLRGSRCVNGKIAPPRYLGAAGIAFGLVETGGDLEVPGDFALGETDHTGNTYIPIPAQAINQHDPAVSFKGAWGLDNNLSLGHSTKPIVLDDGPPSPTNHDEWKHPATKILCNTFWFARKTARPAAKNCPDS